MSSFKRFNRIILIGGIKFGNLVLSIVKRYSVLGGSYLRDSTVLQYLSSTELC